MLFDAVVLPAGAEAADALSELGHALDFLKDQYRHCKPMLVLGESRKLLEALGIFAELPDGQPDPGLLLADEETLKSALPTFADAIAKHRHFEREVDPPVV